MYCVVRREWGEDDEGEDVAGKGGKEKKGQIK